ncbi:MAG TPA: hypothetical protein VLI72_05505 [Methylibium sp.]|nr:hypothetical protein [Methylibium sp.]
MDPRQHPVPDRTVAAEPWPAATWLYRSEGFAEDLIASPVEGAAPPVGPRRSDWGLGMVRRLVRLSGVPVVGGTRPVVLQPA